jgi:hypothetical protein
MMKYLAILALVVLSCSKQGGSGKEPAIGKAGKINIVVNPSIWSGSIGQTLDSLFSVEMTVLPRPESAFRYRQVNPDEVNASMKRTRNLIFIMALDDNSEAGMRLKGMVTPSTLQAVAADTSIFMSSLPDVYATNQEVLYLFGASKNVLIEKIKKNKTKIADHFNRRERQRLEKGLLNASTTKALADQLAKEHGFSIKIPFGYRLADNQKDFVWLRQINAADDKDIFVAWKQYQSPDDFKKDNLIRFRDDICSRYLYEDPEKPDTYLVTETEVEEKAIETREFNWNGRYAVEMKGLWRSNSKLMGGPFQGFAVVDEKRGRFYYVEGFTFSPGKEQREIMRELETILYSFSIPK